MMLYKLLKEVEAVKDNISLVIKDLKEDEWILQHREREIYKSASLIKIPIMVEALCQAEEGKYDLREKIRIPDREWVGHSLISDLSLEEYPFLDLISLMIILSDNTATNVLIELLGFGEINERIYELGCNSTILRRKMLDFEAAERGRENLTSLTDMALVMEKIYRKSIINPQACQLMMDILARQRHRNKLAKHISEGVKIAHKTGELPGIDHDIGIFYLDNRDYLIGVLTENNKDDLEGKEVIARISKLAYDFLSQTER